MRQLQVPEQLFPYADAYRSAAAVLCQNMKSDATPCAWPNAAVVLMLAAHVVELFLKGALLKRNPAVNVEAYKHSIDSFSAEYRLQFPEPSFKWDIPFASDLTEAELIAKMRDPSLTKEQIEEQIEGFKRVIAATPDPSILYRYAVDRVRRECLGSYGFEPHSFLVLLGQVESDFNRIKSQLA